LQGLGAYLNQGAQNNVAGFRAKAEGIALGADWNVINCMTMGLAGSYTKANVDDNNINPKDQSIESWQGILYGWFEFPEGLYLDTIFGIAANKYKTNRIINVNQIHTAAQADFDGKQYGAQADLGWLAWTQSTCYVAPFARLTYMHLQLDDYTE